MNRYYVVVLGLVQQVGFRYFVFKTASELNLSGWVRNCSNGNVELEVQGNEESIVRFLAAVRKGSRFSRVDDISSKKIDTKLNEKSFKIKE